MYIIWSIINLISILNIKEKKDVARLQNPKLFLINFNDNLNNVQSFRFILYCCIRKKNTIILRNIII